MPRKFGSVRNEWTRVLNLWWFKTYRLKSTWPISASNFTLWLCS
jgi:hypothetical protein